jgi:hypothetical protein
LLTIELREANAVLLAAQRKTAEAQEIANQKLLSAVTQPALRDATVKDLISEIRSRTIEELRASCATEEEFDALIKLAQERTPSPDIASKHITSEALTGQA